MTEIFVAYAREDRIQALRFAEMLRRLGLGVHVEGAWTNDAPWPAYWSKTLREARAAAVLWTPASANDPLVLAEAREARDAGKLTSIIFEPDGLRHPPAPFEDDDVVRLSADLSDEARLETLADAFRTHIAETSEASEPTAEDPGPDATDLADRFIAAAQADENARWSALFDDDVEGFERRAKTAFDSAARSLARAKDARWRSALALCAEPDTRLAGVSRLEDLAEELPDGKAWRRVVAAIAAPYYPWRALGSYALSGADEAELSGLTTPHAFSELKTLRLGDAQTATAAAVASPPARRAKPDSRAAGAVGWVALVAALIAGLAFAPSLIERFAPTGPAEDDGAEVQALAELDEAEATAGDAPDESPDLGDASAAEEAAVTAANAGAQAEVEAADASVSEDTPSPENVAADPDAAAVAPAAEDAQPIEVAEVAADVSAAADETVTTAERASEEADGAVDAAVTAAEPAREELAAIEPEAAEVLAPRQIADAQPVPEASEETAEPVLTEDAPEPEPAEPEAVEPAAVDEAAASRSEDPQPETAATEDPAASADAEASASTATVAATTASAASTRTLPAPEPEPARSTIETSPAPGPARSFADLDIAPELALACSRDAATSHLVEQGDNLWLISELYYGPLCGELFPVIWRCNVAVLNRDPAPASRGPDAIYPGDDLIVPTVAEGRPDWNACPSGGT